MSTGSRAVLRTSSGATYPHEDDLAWVKAAILDAGTRVEICTGDAAVTVIGRDGEVVTDAESIASAPDSAVRVCRGEPTRADSRGSIGERKRESELLTSRAHRAVAGVLLASVLTGCAEGPGIEASPAQQGTPVAEVRQSIEESVAELNNGDLEAWCEGLYFVRAPGRAEGEFTDRDESTPFEDADEDLRQDCLTDEYLVDQGPIEDLEIGDVQVTDDRATASVEFTRGPEREEDRMLLRRFGEDWLIQYRLQ